MKYCTLLADPPWPYHSPKAVIGNGGRGFQNGLCKNRVQVNVLSHYNTLTIDDLKSLKIKDLIEDNAHLYLWTTNSFIVEAHEIAKSWGFKPKTLITWVKTKKSSKDPSMKTGYWYRSATEHILFAVRGKLKLLGSPHPTAFLIPRLPHSVKPDYCYELIESQSPGPYLELFARKLRTGWDSWGNEIQSTISI